jgi:HAD superfamily hydrolase (TIGR01509 family)
MKNKKHIFFDFDGVLVNSEPFYLGFWKKELSILNIEFEGFDLIGKTNDQFLDLFNLDNYDKKILIEKKIIAEKLFFENKKISSEILYFLESKKNQYNYSIVSNNSLLSINSFLSYNNCEFYFDLIIHRELGYLPKPYPDSFIAAVQTLNIAKDQVIVIEDSLIGCEAAKSAGLN